VEQSGGSIYHFVTRMVGQRKRKLCRTNALARWLVVSGSMLLAALFWIGIR